MPQETTTAQALVHLEGVSKVFGAGTQRVTAIADLSLSLQQGDSLSVVGPSGCGKTTLLLLLAGLERPSTGSLMLQGNPLAGTRTEIALVLQHYGLFPWKTVRRNIELGFTIRRERHFQQRVSAMLDRLGIADKERAFPGMRDMMAPSAEESAA